MDDNKNISHSENERAETASFGAEVTLGDEPSNSSSRPSSSDHGSSKSSSSLSRSSGSSSSSRHRSSSSGHRSSSGSSSSRSGRSSSSSSSRHGSSRSSSSGHRSSGSSSSRSRSGSSGRSHRSRRRSSSGRYREFRHNLKSKLYKYKPKYLYRKYKYRFKKANKVKKAGYILVLLSFVALIGLGTWFLAFGRKKGPEVNDKNYGLQEIGGVSNKNKAPQISELYSLNDTKSLAGTNFTAGFMIKIPKLNAESADAEKMNAEMAELENKIKKEYSQAVAGDLSLYPYLHDISYRAFSSKQYVFISVYDHFQHKDGELEVKKVYYLYDYINDVMVDEDDYFLPDLFEIEEVQILETVNAKFQALGRSPANDTEGFDYYVDRDGKLCALIKTTTDSGAEIEIDVTLT